MAKRRGRPRKEPEASPQNQEAQIAIEQQKEFAENKGKCVDKWYQLRPGSKGVKVLQKTRFENGNVYSVYLGREKELKEQINKWRSQGLLRA